MTTDTKALRAMLEKATRGAWTEHESIHGSIYRFVQIGDNEMYTTLELEPADAALIVAMHNALPALLDELDAARRDAVDAARYRWLRDQLRKTGGANWEVRVFTKARDGHGQYLWRNAALLDSRIDAARGEDK